MKKKNIIIIIIVAALLVVLFLCKSGVFTKKKTNTETDADEIDNGGTAVTDSALTNDESERTSESFDDLSEVSDYGLLNPNKLNR